MMDIPAFPMPASEHSQGGHFEQYGMTLRDYFAAAALQGMCADAENMEAARKVAKSRSSAAEVYSRIAYDFADAMIAERNKRNAQD